MVANQVVLRILTTNPTDIKGSNDFPLSEISLRNLQKAQAEYRSCMDEKRLQALGRRPILNDLQLLVTDIYPVRNSLLAPSFPGAKVPVSKLPTSLAIDRDRLTAALIQFTKAGDDALFRVMTADSSEDPNYEEIYVASAPLTFMETSDYADMQGREELKNFLTKVFTLYLGVSQSRPDQTTELTLKHASVLANHVLDFETKIANISVEGDISLYNVAPQDITEIHPIVDWPRYIKAIFGNFTNVNVPSVAYLTGLASILNETTDAQLQVYFAWRLILARYRGLSSEYRRPIEIFMAIINGVDPNEAAKAPNRLMTCFEVVNKDLGAIIGHFYLSVAFSAEASKKSEEIIDALLETYRIELTELEWLDETTRQRALEKLDAMIEVIAYSRVNPDVSSSESLALYYSQLTINEDDYYGNQNRARAWRRAQRFSKAGKRKNRQEMDTTPQTVNAYYNPLLNQILFPAGILQKPIFATHDPEYLNFGSFGMIAGHEITHGFDNVGRTHGPDGKKTNWWTDESSAQFEEKAACFVNEYNKFSVQDPKGQTLYVNGTLTLGENISDNGGIKMAYSAWSRRLASDPMGKMYNNQLLPGLEKYTREQLFFVGFAQTWCVKATPSFLVKLIKTDEHSPARARINGVVRNSVDFATAFKCKPDTKMNPTKKCELW
ncbi:hypothetical protein BGZ73_004290 [Actinomortierella ambigua]|nr:hypothetical protein BGZ73_004290 [Actinomortierella ambigua]